MKTVTTREVQHHFAKVAAWVDAGEEVLIKRRGKSDLRLTVPAIDRGAKKVDWSDTVKQLRERLPTLPKMKKNAVVEMRDEERF